VQSAADLEAPVTIGVEAYVSPEYARALSERLRQDRPVSAPTGVGPKSLGPIEDGMASVGSVSVSMRLHGSAI
jgi:hypothetical protein